MEDVQNDWLTHVEKAVYSGSRAASAGLPINCATAMRMDVPLQKLLFSATLSQNPEKLQELSLYEPKLFTSTNIGNLQNQEEEEKHDFVGKFTTPAELTETILKVDNSLQKPLLLANLIKQRNMKKALIFTNSIESAHQLTLVLKQLDLNSVAEISSDMKSKRSKIINMFKSEKANNKIDFLVSTDALARGIDIGTIDFVISYDSPKYIKTYIHR